MTDYKKLISDLDAGCNDGADLPDLLNRAARAIEALLLEGLTQDVPEVEPERTYLELMQDDQIRYTAARDSKGGIRLSRGHGALVANPGDTREDVLRWFSMAGSPKWAAWYKAALNLIDAEMAGR